MSDTIFALASAKGRAGVFYNEGFWTKNKRDTLFPL